MFSRHVPNPAAVAKSPDDSRRAVIQRRAIARLFGEALLDVPADNFGKRQPALASLGPQSPRLLVGQLNSAFGPSRACKHIMM